MSEIVKNIVYSEVEPSDTGVLWLKESKLGNLSIMAYGANGWEGISNSKQIPIILWENHPDRNLKVIKDIGLDNYTGERVVYVYNSQDKFYRSVTFQFTNGNDYNLQGKAIGFVLINVVYTQLTIHYSMFILDLKTGKLSKDSLSTDRFKHNIPIFNTLGLSDLFNGSNIGVEVRRMLYLWNGWTPPNSSTTTAYGPFPTIRVKIIGNNTDYFFPIVSATIIDTKNFSVTFLVEEELQTYTFKSDDDRRFTYTIKRVPLTEYQVYKRYVLAGGTKSEAEFNQKLKELIDA